MADPQNDNHLPAGPDHDAHGRASYLLIDSLLHELVARSIIPLEAALEVVDIAAEVGAAVADEQEHGSVPMPDIADILKMLAASLRSNAQH